MSWFSKFLVLVIILLGVLYFISTDEQKEYYKSKVIYYKNKLKDEAQKAMKKGSDEVEDAVEEIKETIEG